jgi:hypothetical protein
MTASKTQPALLGGLFIGVLSALPVINAGNCCCCLWVVAGGALAAYLLQQNQPDPISTGDAAVAGLMAGLVGAVIGTLLAIPFNMLTMPLMQSMVEQFQQNAEDLPDELRGVFEGFSKGASGRSPGAAIVFGVLGFLFTLVVDTIFATLGGVLGAAMFRRKPSVLDAPPPPPPFAPSL